MRDGRKRPARSAAVNERGFVEAGATRGGVRSLARGGARTSGTALLEEANALSACSPSIYRCSQSVQRQK